MSNLLGEKRMFNKEKVLILGDLKARLENYSYRKKKLILLVFVMIGILMMMLPGVVGGSNKRVKLDIDRNFNVGLYETELEQRLLDIVEKIKGVGKAKIMITLENSVEYIYAQEKREKTDKVNDYQDKVSVKTQERNDEERKFMLVDGPNGKRQALIKTQIQPKVKGVVIVCQGGDNAVVSQQITNLVTTILNISSTRVYVTKSL